MIGYLRGKVLSQSGNKYIVDVGGVGYEVDSVDYLEISKEVELFIHTYIREQDVRLFGFLNQEDIKFFVKLLSVSGVGPKAAMVMMSTLGAKKILEALEAQKIDMLKVKGVGEKTARKILFELKGYIAKDQYSKQKQVPQNLFDAIEALERLGYSREEVKRAADKIEAIEKLTSEEVVKKLLSTL